MGAFLNIGVNNSQFNAAMKQIANELKNVDAKFKESSTQAKLFGTATDQLKAKQTELTSKMQIYSKAIESVGQRQQALTSKIDTLKTKQTQLAQVLEKTKKAYEDSVKASGKNSEESKKLAEELQKITKEYNNNEKAIQRAEKEMTNANTKMSESKTKMMECEHELDNINSKLSSAKFDQIGDKFQSIGGKIEGVGKKMLPLATGIAGIGAASVKTGMDFDYAMSDLSATAGATGDDFQKLRDKAKELGASTCKSATDSAQAMKYLALSGQDTGQILQTVEPTLKASVAFGEDLARTADLETDSMSALGLEVSDLTHYLDICGQAQRSSNTTASQLMEAYIGCGGTLRNFGVSAEESATILGIMANQGIKGAEAGNSLQSVLVNLMGISGQASDALDALGMSAYDDEGHFKGVHNVLEELKVKLAECTEQERDAFVAMIGGKTQMDSLNAMLQATGGTYDDLKGKIDNCNGACNEMYDTMQNNGKGKLEAMKSAMEGCAIAISDALAPAMTAILEKLTAFFSWFAKLPEPMQKTIVSIGALIVGLTGLLIAVGKIITAIGTAIKIVGAFKEIGLIARLGGLVAKIGSIGSICSAVFGIISEGLVTIGAAIVGVIGWPALIIAGIVAIAVAIGVLLYKHCEPFRNFIDSLWEKIKNFGAWLLQAITNLPQTISQIWSMVVETCTQSWDMVVQFFTKSVPQWLESMGKWFAELPKKIAFGLGYALASIYKWGADCIEYLQTNVPKWIDNVGQWFSELPSKIGQWITQTYNNIVTWGTNLFSYLAQAIPQIIDSIGQWFSQLPGQIGSWLSQVLSNLATWGENMISTAGQKMKQCANDIINAFKELPGKMIDIGKNIVEGIKNGIKNAWGSFINWAKGLCDSFVDGVKSALDIHSPSRRMAKEVGQFIPAGIKIGIEDNFPQVNESMKKQIDYTVQVANESVDHINAKSSQYKQQPVKTDNTEISNKLDQLINLISNLNLDVILDGQSLVKKTAPNMSNQLAFNNSRKRF